MMSKQVGGNFRQEADGSLTVIDGLVILFWTRSLASVFRSQDFLASYKHHPVYGTFFKGAKRRWSWYWLRRY
jgi:hypothetical protein